MRDGLLSSMLLFFLLPLLCHADFKAEIASMADAVKWPKVCTEHPYAIAADAKELANDQGQQCTLTFPMFVGSTAERWSLCQDRFPDILIQVAGDEKTATTKCIYKRFESCDDGHILVKGECFAIQEKTADYKTAEKECKNMEAEVTTEQHEELLRFPMYLWNPMRWISDVKSVWVSDKKVMIYRRAVGANAKSPASLPGTVEAPENLTKHRFYCVYPGKKSRSAIKRFCEVARNSLKLATTFYNGVCFMITPSVYSQKPRKDPKKRMPRSEALWHYHQKCKWVSKYDHAVAPNTQSKWDGMIKARKAAPWLKNSRLLVPGMMAEGGGSKMEYFFFYRQHGNQGDLYEPLTITHMWANNRPKEDNDGPNDAIAMGLENENGHRLVDVPSYWRGHLVCASGVSKNEAPLKECATEFGPEWKGALRDDGTVMCISVYFKELANKKYSEIKEFCKQHNSFVAPIASANEQKNLQELMEKAREGITENRDFGGGVLLGAQKIAPLDVKGNAAKFQWDYDGSTVIYSNWAHGEPSNNQHKLDPNHEMCISAYADKGDGRYGKWFDQHCEVGDDGQWRIIGGVCAKPLTKHN